MGRIFDTTNYGQETWLLCVALVLCLAGAGLSMRVFRRLRAATKGRRQTQWILSALLSGTTVWSTHLLAMLAHDPSMTRGVAMELAALSLFVAIFGMLLANSTFRDPQSMPRTVVGGILFGLTISLTHFVGMEAFMDAGLGDLDIGIFAISILLGTGFAIGAFHRAAYPITRYCWLGGAIFISLCIITTHIFGMAAIEMQIHPQIEAPPDMIANQVLGFIIFGVTALVLSIGYASLSIETSLEGEAQSKLAHSTSHDHLTGIPNRLWLTEFLGGCGHCDAMHPNPPPTAIIAIDLDGFKQINDLHGHSFGDTVLMTVAERLTATCEAYEYITRTGSDEFTAIKTHFANEAEVEEFARRMVRSIGAAIPSPCASASTREIHLSAWVGFATSLLDGDTSSGLIQKADFAMHRAKATGEKKLSTYNAEMSAQSRERLMLEQDLNRAAVQQELFLVYQLQHELEGLEPIGCEALLRWKHPERGVVSPAEFIPIAEQTGLICRIGLWVLRTACLEAASWTRPLSLAVNVAPQQLVEPNFLEDLADVLFESNLAPERLELEVTEASVISDQAAMLDIVQRIKQMGVRIAMDDFGTGYSSLATLQAFPFDKIKIDRSFVTDVDQKPQRAAIVRATLLLGRALGIPVLAEGVENEEELAFLQKEGCNCVQGFYFGRPLSLADMRRVGFAPDPQQDTACAP